MGDSLKELDESAYWLRHLDDSQLGTATLRTALRKEADELIRIFVSSIKTARND